MHNIHVGEVADEKRRTELLSGNDELFYLYCDTVVVFNFHFSQLKIVLK
jgi:hypothetical protein